MIPRNTLLKISVKYPSLSPCGDSVLFNKYREKSFVTDRNHSHLDTHAVTQ